MITVLIAVTGGLGAALRFWADGAIRARWQTALPVATIGINTAGSLLIGVLAGLLGTGTIGVSATVLSIGLCGGFTTFSTAMVESARLLLAGDRRRCAANLAITMMLTLAAAALGFALATAIVQ
ncbi:fluoride efflux transporter FluC [Ruania halotolerans]|uniref:fluoride efflux transporter FluC n=1 Tax=Ruania halotolerans TaxID=2897773 RepID=UPI001E523D24|nr:CrcB family protein [Ruania halotolerans]UFU06005.1 CrcB family protein [Ruania halotolerans]